MLHAVCFSQLWRRRFNVHESAFLRDPTASRPGGPPGARVRKLLLAASSTPCVIAASPVSLAISGAQQYRRARRAGSGLSQESKPGRGDRVQPLTTAPKRWRRSHYKWVARLDWRNERDKRAGEPDTSTKRGAQGAWTQGDARRAGAPESEHRDAQLYLSILPQGTCGGTTFPSSRFRRRRRAASPWLRSISDRAVRNPQRRACGSSWPQLNRPCAGRPTSRVSEGITVVGRAILCGSGGEYSRPNHGGFGPVGAQAIIPAGGFASLPCRRCSLDLRRPRRRRPSMLGSGEDRVSPGPNASSVGVFHVQFVGQVPRCRCAKR